MKKPVLQLYPQPGGEVPLEGLYLGHELRQPLRADEPFVYANFISSVDGRIAVQDPEGPGLVVPETIANPRDWRLFQELAAQADVLITTGRYLRDYADGRAQEILQVYDDPSLADLKGWRLANGLPPQPDLAVLSASLDFPVPPVLQEGGRSVIIVTTGQADPGQVSELEAQTGKVIAAGDERVEGGRLVEALRRLGYRYLYSTGGPKVVHTLLSAGALDRLYLTLAPRALGGSRFSSLVDGSPLAPPADFEVRAVYLDPHALGGIGQLFAVFDRHPRS